MGYLSHFQRISTRSAGVPVINRNGADDARKLGGGSVADAMNELESTSCLHDDPEGMVAAWVLL